MKKFACAKGLQYCARKTFLIMKMSTIFLLLALQVSATNYGQNINLKEADISLTEVFKKIEKQSNYRFYYSNDVITADRFISVNAVNASLKDVLKEIFTGSSLVWNVVNRNKIVISSKDDNSNTLSPGELAQRITGTVTNEKGEPLENVSIVVKGTTLGTITNAEGKFSIEVPETNAILEITRVGYETKEVAVSTGESLSITLTAVQGSMDEVIVVGYGTQRRTTLTGAAGTVSNKLLTNRPTTSVTNSLQGTVPGLTILSRPGDVGNDIATVNVRGRGNLGTSSPLFVVDGMIVSAGDFARINPSDIENFTVLKDAAAAIYGSRAAYGVVLVTTKRGAGGKMRVNYNLMVGNQKATYLPKKAGAVDYMILRNEAAGNVGTSLPFTEANIEKARLGNEPDMFPNNNWYDLVYRNAAPLTQHDLNISGGGATRYYLGLAYMNQASLQPDKGLKRYNIRANTNSKVSEILNVGTNITFIRDDIKNEGGTFSTTSLARMVPTMVAKQSDGSWGTINAGRLDATLGGDNPLRMMKEGGRETVITNRFLGNLTATLKPIDNLSIDGQLSYNFRNYDRSTFVKEMNPLINFLTKQPILGSGKSPNSILNRMENETTLLAQLYATYGKVFNTVHDFKLMAGTSYEDNKWKYLQAERRNVLTNELDAINAGSSADGNVFNEGNTLEKAFQSVFARLNYAYDNRYLLEGVLRADGSSQFAPNKRWGYYPGVLAAWRISGEKFMQNVNWVQDLKIRASYGTLGNVANVGYYDYFSVLQTGTAAILDNGRVDGVWPNILANPDLTWEKVISKNLGLDASFLNRRLTMQLDLFDKLTTDILLRVPQPTEFGLVPNSNITLDQRPAINAAKVSNKGIELTLGYSDNIGQVQYNINGNLTKIWNKITDMYGQPDQISGYYINRFGEAIGSYYGYQTRGLFGTTADTAGQALVSTATRGGDIRYVDQNGDGRITAADRVILGNDVPYFTYGLNGSLSYKGIDFSFIGQGVANVDVYLGEEASQAFFNGAGPKEFHLGRWTKENPNPNAAYPRVLLSANNNQNQQISDFWLFNASYFRIKALTLGYTLPKTIVAKAKLENVRAFLSANNYITFRGDKRLKDFDPEAPSARASYPQLKTMSFGLNVTF